MSTQEQDAAEVARIRKILADAALEPPRHLSPEELFGHVDGTLDAASRQAVEEHLQECALCREDAADLQPLRAAAPPRRWMWLAAAAAVSAVFVAVAFLQQPEAPPPAPLPRAIVRPKPAPPAPAPAERPRYANDRWNDLVETALASGRLSYSENLGELRGTGESLRGAGREAATLLPSGVVIDTVRPTMRWPRVENATYRVVVFDGEQAVARSEPLERERWTLPRALRRGRTYSWQVEAKTATEIVILPSPESPPAHFRVVDAQTHEEIATARRLHPDDHLLLAVLYARAGMEKEAKEHLRQIDDASDPRAARLKSGR